jgi:selenocysteine lyase/cysteine desulfurase
MLLRPTEAPSEHVRHLAFPVTKNRIFLAHAGVCALPRCAVEKMQEGLYTGMIDQQENDGVFREVQETRAIAASLIKATPQTISLIGPTSLGLNLVAQGLDWQEGDEVIFYPDDYPANVYPWQNLSGRGVKPVPLSPEWTGHITPDLVLQSLTARTRLVALSSCHFLTGYRIDYRAIGEELQKRGILFCLDGIQSLGATTLDSHYFDFLCADSHKWLLGPLGAGIFYVKESVQERLRPSLLGSWNVNSPRYVAQPEINLESGGRRYECGSLYVHGILGMRASMELLLKVGLEQIEARLIHLHHFAAVKLRAAGYTLVADQFAEGARSGIITVTKPGGKLAEVFQTLQHHHVSASLRWDRAGESYLRFSPHFYNTEEELTEVARLMAE